MIDRWWRFADRYPRIVEAAFLLLLGCGTSSEYLDSETPWWIGLPIMAAACLSLLWRRRRPGAVAAFTGVCAAASGGLGYVISPQMLIPVYVAFYALAVRTPGRTVRTYWLIVWTLIVVGSFGSDISDEPWIEQVVPPAFWIMLPAIYGAAVRARRAYLDAVRARAEHAERTREEEARHRVAEERVRIARELHDVVAHHMALANAQAGTAAHITRTRPEEAERMLVELTGTTSSALRELRATVGLLRRPDDPEESLEPSPGLDRLHELVSSFASTGLQATVTVDGEERPLSAGADLAAFRIVQEALTNVTKHAATNTAQVRLTYTGDQMILTVSNDGGAVPHSSTSGGGFGLLGMRERAQSAGGHLQAGHRREGGFAVTAELPIHS